MKPVVLRHAAQFLKLEDAAASERLLKRGEAMEPRSPGWKNSLGHLYELASSRGPAARKKAAARKALKKYEEAQKLTPERTHRFYQLPDLAKVALAAGDLKKGRRFAELAIAEAATITDWAHGNGIHHGHIILGQIALAEEDLPLAARHLLDAGRTRGSPQLDSFGPDFALAEELLRRGMSEPVLEYFALCGGFWSMGLNALDAWSVMVRAGNVPNFDEKWRYL